MLIGNIVVHVVIRVCIQEPDIVSIRFIRKRPHITLSTARHYARLNEAQ
jgi:hypothetical protein